jgi:hypothetical protein
VTAEPVREAIPQRRRAVLLTLVALAAAAVGLTWAKWLPYADRIGHIAGSGTFPGSSLLDAASAPITVTLRRVGVPTSTAVAFWLGNPVLNPAVLVLLALVAPWSWVAVRSRSVCCWSSGSAPSSATSRHGGTRSDEPPCRRPTPLSRQPSPTRAPATSISHLMATLAGRLFRTSAVLVPEYLLVVFLVGLMAQPLAGVLGEGGALAVLVAAAVGAHRRAPDRWRGPDPARPHGDRGQCRGARCVAPRAAGLESAFSRDGGSCPRLAGDSRSRRRDGRPRRCGRWGPQRPGLSCFSRSSRFRSA